MANQNENACLASTLLFFRKLLQQWKRCTFPGKDATMLKLTKLNICLPCKNPCLITATVKGMTLSPSTHWHSSFVLTSSILASHDLLQQKIIKIKFLLKAWQGFIRKFAPRKISCYTVPYMYQLRSSTWKLTQGFFHTFCADSWL